MVLVETKDNVNTNFVGAAASVADAETPRALSKSINAKKMRESLSDNSHRDISSKIHREMSSLGYDIFTRAPNSKSLK